MSDLVSHQKAVVLNCSWVIVGLVILGLSATLMAQPAFTQEDQELEQALERYRQSSPEARKAMQGPLKAMIETRRKALTAAYREQVESIYREKRGALEEAIAALEGFIKRHPNHPKYTPEVMLTLAELYYEEAVDAYRSAEEEYSEKQALYERGKIPEPPALPTKDYSKAVNVYHRLVESFPKFSKIDQALYSMGLCYKESQELEKAKDAFERLVKTRPESELAPPAWVQLGDIAFDAGGYAESLHYYEQALAVPDLSAKNPYTYVRALYRYGWAYFQLFDYPNSIKAFKRLLTEVEEWLKPGSGAEDGERRRIAADIRSEVVKCLGMSLADEDWDNNGERDPDFSVERALSYLNEGKPFEDEVLETFADTLFETHQKLKVGMAVEAYNALIAKNPLHPRCPSIKEKIIGVYDTFDLDAAMKERLDLAHRFGPGSAWYEANKKDPKVVAKAEERVQTALEVAGTYYHAKGRELRKEFEATHDAMIGAKALESFKMAAQVYRLYLDKYPQSKKAYELSAYLAECLYFSFNYEEAARVYEKVRDWEGQSKYLEVSAYGVIDSIEMECKKRVKDGQLAQEDVPGEIKEVQQISGGEATEGLRTVTPKPIPPLTQWWIKAIDIYLGKGLKPEKDPDLPARLAYRAAMEFYKYLHIDEARKRFVDLIERFPDSPVVNMAAIMVINTYKLVNDWAGVEEWSKKLQEKGLGKPEERAKLQEELRLYQLGAQFKEAERLFESGEYVKAGDTFVALVDQDPKYQFADKALNNAALAYQKAKMFDSAYRVYERIVTQYPQSEFVEGALIQMGAISEKFFDFERAIRSYGLLRKKFPKSVGARHALYITGYLLAAEGRTEEAASTMVEFARTYPDDPEAPKTLIKAYRIYQELGKLDEALKTVNAFVSRYGKDPKWSVAVVEALARAAEIHYARGNKAEFERTARTVIREFEARNLQPGDPVAAYPAKFQFMLIEPMFKEYEAIKITGKLEEQGRKIKRKMQLLYDLTEEYSKVVVYQIPEWTTAALFRVAKVHELFADALYEAEVPPLSDEEMEIFRQQIEEKASEYLAEAQKRYRQIIEEARKSGISTAWVNKAREAMNRYSPQEFPLFKEDRRVEETHIWHIPPFEEEL